MEKLDKFPLEAVEPDFEAQEGIILNVADFFRHRRALSEAQEESFVTNISHVL